MAKIASAIKTSSKVKPASLQFRTAGRSRLIRPSPFDFRLYAAIMAAFLEPARRSKDPLPLQTLRRANGFEPETDRRCHLDKMLHWDVPEFQRPDLRSGSNYPL